MSSNGNVLAIGVMCLSSVVWTAPGDQMQIRTELENLRIHCATSRLSSLATVKEWGFPNTITESAPFTNAVAAISNDWHSMSADWDYYWTNGDMRVIIPNIVGYAGTNALIGVWGDLLDIYEADTNRCSLSFMHLLYSAGTTPCYHYVFMNTDIPAISNLFVRMHGLYPPEDAEMARYFSSIFSGERKIEETFIYNLENYSDEYAMEQLTNSVPHQQ